MTLGSFDIETYECTNCNRIIRSKYYEMRKRYLKDAKNTRNEKIGTMKDNQRIEFFWSK